MTERDGHLSDAELADLAALADGSLPPARRESVAARVERSPELRALVEEQRVALDAVRALDVPAPASLRAHGRVERRARLRTPRRRVLALSGGFAAAAAALLAILVLPGGDAGPTVQEVARLYDSGASSPAPRPAEPNLLDASVERVQFPDYRAKFGWRADGQRSDEVEGRSTRTVFYERRDREIAYSIVAGDSLKWPAGARRTTVDGVELRSLERDGTTVVTWLRDGRTCVLSGSDVPRAELLELAAWKGKGAVAF